jgi:phosphoribosylformylglycinamidine (FGAM) synthase-like amidotransferase family enzyme
MKERVTHSVTVSDITDRFVWFSIDGSDKDIEVPIPKHSGDQSSQTEKTISSLEIDDRCRLTFVDENGRCTAWYAGFILILDT